MSRDEALCATLNAARALRRYGCTNELLAQLYSAVDAVDRAGDADPDAPYGHQDARSAVRDACEACGTIAWAGAGEREYCAYCALVVDAVRFRAQLAELRGDRPGFCQGAEDCWRQPDLPGGRCHHHSTIAQKPHPFENMRMRDRMFRDVADQDG